MLFVRVVRYLQNGPAHLIKNLAAAMRSPSHTLHVGRYPVDMGSTLDLQMPCGAFVGFDGQSDREALTFLNCSLDKMTGLKT